MTSSSLIDDISAEVLVCRICLEQLRRPKTLSCRHTFCEVCLEKLRESELSTADDDERVVTSRRSSRRTRSSPVEASRVTCPVCYDSCPLPPGGVCRLPDDPVVTQLYNIIERRKSTAAQTGDGDCCERLCEICIKSSTRHRVARVQCVECSKLMCSPCARQHRRTNVTSGHSLLDVDNAELSMEYQHHSGELVRFYCNTCDVCVCVLCTYHRQPHCGADHDVLSFSDAIALHQAPLTVLLAECQQRLHDVRARYDAVVAFDQLVRKVEDNIREVAMETVSYVRRQERQLVAALRSTCGDVDDETRVGRKTQLADHVRRLEDACHTADNLLNAVSEGSGPAAFLVQRRRTVDTMTSLMTSQTTSVTDWPKYERQVRFEAYGLDSALGLRVGRLVIDDEDSDIEDISSDRQLIHTHSAVDGGSDWIEVKLRDISVQTVQMDQPVSASSRCEASGSVSASTTRPSVSHDENVLTGRRPPAGASSSSSAAAAATTTTTAAAAETLTEHMTSLRDASTSATVDVVSSSTITDRLQTCDQSTCVDYSVISSDKQTSTEPLADVDHQQTSTEPLADVDHRAVGTDDLQTCTVGVTAAPATTDKSTSTDTYISSRAESHMSDNDDNKLTDDDDDLIQTSRLSMPTVIEDSVSLSQQVPCSYSTAAGDSSVFVGLPVTPLQPTLGSAFNVSHLSSATVNSTFARPTPTFNTDDCDECRAVSPTARLAAMLPDITRTADVLAASHFSSGLTARLLRDIVDVGLQMTSCKRQTRDPATDTTDQQTSTDISAVPLSSDTKWTQTMVEYGDVVDLGVGESVVTTSDASTMTKVTPMTFDKETSTVRAHQVNKNVATDSLSTADKQTWMSIDVATAYLKSTTSSIQRVISVSRGTSTSQRLVDRATSPLPVTLVDKSVTASKAEALQPVDTFHAAGQLLSGPLSPRSRRLSSLSPRSKLACISESAEHYEEENVEELDDVSAMSELVYIGQSRQQQVASDRCMSTSPQQHHAAQLSRNIFNFDHVITSRFAELSTDSQRPLPLDDDLKASSVDGDVANMSASADDKHLTAVIQSSEDHVDCVEHQLTVDNTHTACYQLQG